MGTLPQVWTDKVKLLPSRRTMYVGGNKKVLLRDRKRHFAVLSLVVGGIPVQGVVPPTPWLGLGYPLAGTGVPPREKTWDQRPGKKPGTGVPPWKGHGTRDLGKYLGLG